MSKTVELRAEIVENDAGDIVMRLKDRKGAITFHRASGASGPKAYKKLRRRSSTRHHRSRPRAASRRCRTSLYTWAFAEPVPFAPRDRPCSDQPVGRTSKRTDSAPCSRTDPNRSRPLTTDP